MHHLSQWNMSCVLDHGLGWISHFPKNYQSQSGLSIWDEGYRLILALLTSKGLIPPDLANRSIFNGLVRLVARHSVGPWRWCSRPSQGGQGRWQKGLSACQRLHCAQLEASLCAVLVRENQSVINKLWVFSI